VECIHGMNTVILDHSYSKYLACSFSGGDKVPGGSGKFRRNLRRLESRLGGKGDTSWQYISDVQEQNAAFPQFLEVEAAGWKGEDGTSTAIKYDPRVTAFYLELLNSFGQMGLSRINLLKLNGAVIAGQYCLMDEGRINLLKIGYDESYRDTSPGFLLIKNVFEKGCSSNEFKELSFVTGAEWNDVFQPIKREVCVGYLFNTTTVGILSFLLMRAKETMKQWVRRCRQLTAAIKSIGEQS